MRILFLSPRQAWPAVSGAKLRELYFARALASAADLTCLYFSEPAFADHAKPDFLPRAIGVPRPRAYTPAKVASGLFGRWPLPVVNYTAETMEAAIASAVASNRFDLIHLDAVQLAGYVPFLNKLMPGIPVVYDWHNIESELMDRFAANNGITPKGWYARFTAERLRKLERWILNTGHGHIVCSEREREQLRRIAPSTRVEAIDNGVDTAFFHDTAQACGPRTRLLFVGSMSYHANIEAALWFGREIWPAIHSACPNLRLTLAGSNPPPSVKDLARIPGTEVTGTVPDVRPFYAEAFAAIAPIRTAGGTRLKILEAMAAGVPVISTALGAEGLAIVPGKDLMIADTPGEWVNAVVSLSDQTVWKSLTRAGHTLTRTRYDWGTLGDRLCETYRIWLASK